MRCFVRTHGWACQDSVRIAGSEVRLNLWFFADSLLKLTLDRLLIAIAFWALGRPFPFFLFTCFFFHFTVTQSLSPFLVSLCSCTWWFRSIFSVAAGGLICCVFPYKSEPSFSKFGSIWLGSGTSLSFTSVACRSRFFSFLSLLPPFIFSNNSHSSALHACVSTRSWRDCEKSKVAWEQKRGWGRIWEVFGTWLGQ